MKESNWPNSVLAVICGASATVLAFFLSYPLIELTAGPFFELNFGVQDPGLSTNDIIFLLIITGWMALAALIGGLVSALICQTYPYRHAWALVFLSLIFYGYVFADSPRKGEMFYIVLMLVFTTGGFLSGAKFGTMIKMRRRNKLQNPS